MSGLGRWSVSDLSRVPSPAPKTNAEVITAGFDVVEAGATHKPVRGVLPTVDRGLRR